MRSAHRPDVAAVEVAEEDVAQQLLLRRLTRVRRQAQLRTHQLTRTLAAGAVAAEVVVVVEADAAAPAAFSPANTPCV
jgi:hypothetical protein